jgi:hypothetical protein
MDDGIDRGIEGGIEGVIEGYIVLCMIWYTDNWQIQIDFKTDAKKSCGLVPLKKGIIQPSLCECSLNASYGDASVFCHMHCENTDSMHND